MSRTVDCEKCNGSGLVDGHGHVPGKSDYEGREHSCYEAGCPFPCENCHGHGQYLLGDDDSNEVSEDAPF